MVDAADLKSAVAKAAYGFACRGRHSNPYAAFATADFKSAASTISPPRRAGRFYIDLRGEIAGVAGGAAAPHPPTRTLAASPRWGSDGERRFRWNATALRQVPMRARPAPAGPRP